LETSLRLLNQYKPLLDAYMSDFYVKKVWKEIPDRWWNFLEQLEPEECAYLLTCHQNENKSNESAPHIIKTDTMQNKANRIEVNQAKLDHNKARLSRVWPLSLLAFRSSVLSLQLQRRSVDISKLEELIQAGRIIPARLNNNALHKQHPTPRTCNHNTSHIYENHSDVSNICNGQYKFLEHCYRRHVKPKKQHEIVRLGKVIWSMCSQYDVKQVVDVGAGQGHLSRLLAFGYGLKLTTIEAVDCHVPKATKFDDEVTKDISKGRIVTHKQRKKAASLASSADHLNQIETSNASSELHSEPTHVIGCVDPQVTVCEFLSTLKLAETDNMSQGLTQSDKTTLTEPNANKNTEFLLAGLHACGDLTPTMMRVFVACPPAVALASVGCCYMKLSRQSDHSNSAVYVNKDPGFPMSMFVSKQPSPVLTWEALEMACHFVDDYKQKLLNNLPSLRSHVYRCALQEIILDKAPHMEHGSIKLSVKKTYQLPFRLYAEKSLLRLGLDPALTLAQIERAESRIAEWKKVVALYTLRLSLAPLIETVVLLDRVLMLLEHGISGCLVPIFDPLLSPRNFLILAYKTIEKKNSH